MNKRSPDDTRPESARFRQAVKLLAILDRKAKAASKTPAQRKADERQRHKEAGRVAVTVHIYPADRAKLAHYIKRLNERAERITNRSDDT